MRTGILGRWGTQSPRAPGSQQTKNRDMIQCPGFLLSAVMLNLFYKVKSGFTILLGDKTNARSLALGNKLILETHKLRVSMILGN